MRARAMNTVAGESRLMDTEELRAYTNLGRNNAMKLGEEIGAKVKIGKRVLWDKVKIDQYLNNLTGGISHGQKKQCRAERRTSGPHTSAGSGGNRGTCK